MITRTEELFDAVTGVYDIVCRLLAEPGENTAQLISAAEICERVLHPELHQRPEPTATPSTSQ